MSGFATISGAVGLGLSLLTFAGGGAALATPRTPTIEDFLALEDFGVMRADPTGRLLAVEIRRPRAVPAARNQNGEFRSDIVIIDLQTGARRQLNRRVGDAAYWSPIWSPGGSSLAVLTNQGSPYTRAARVDIATGELTILDDRNVALETNFGSASPYPPHGRVWANWLSEGELLTTLLPAGRVDVLSAAGDPAAPYAGLTGRTRRGEPAVTVWDARRPAVCEADASLALIGRQETSELLTGALRAVTLSPDKRKAAVVLATRPRPLGAEPSQGVLNWNAYNTDPRVETELKLVDLEAGTVRASYGQLTDLGFISVRRQPWWSRSGEAIGAPIATPDGRHYVASISLGSLSVRAQEAASPSQAEALAALDPDEVRPLATDLFAHDVEDNNVRNLLVDVARLDNGQVVVAGPAGAALLDEQGQERRRLSRHPSRLIFPTDRPTSSPVMLLAAGEKTLLLRQTGSSVQMTPLAAPASGASAQLVTPDGRRVIWLRRQEDRLELWVTEGAARRRLMALNGFLRELRPQRTMTLAYQALGQPLGAALLLPDDYRPGRAYPVVIEAYPRVNAAKGDLGRHFAATNYQSFHRRLLTARGYVVAIPSMPIPPGQQPFDPFETAGAQIEALARALIDQGIARPGGVGVYGHSYGGYSALAAASISKNLSAVVSSAPFGDLVYYGDHPFVAYDAEDCAPSRHAFHASELEDDAAYFLRMQSSSHEQLEAYLDKSPRYRIGAASPPILLLQGDLDASGFRTADALYMRLSRLGVPVQLARYWGEEHVISGPGNIRDSWQRTLAWFDTYLKPAARPSGG